MSKRAVQVWFQNRRAKEKDIKKKSAEFVLGRNESRQVSHLNVDTNECFGQMDKRLGYESSGMGNNQLVSDIYDLLIKNSPGNNGVVGEKEVRASGDIGLQLNCGDRVDNATKLGSCVNSGLEFGFNNLISNNDGIFSILEDRASEDFAINYLNQLGNYNDLNCNNNGIGIDFKCPNATVIESSTKGLIAGKKKDFIFSDNIIGTFSNAENKVCVYPTIETIDFSSFDGSKKSLQDDGLNIVNSDLSSTLLGLGTTGGSYNFVDKYTLSDNYTDSSFQNSDNWNGGILDINYNNYSANPRRNSYSTQSQPNLYQEPCLRPNSDHLTKNINFSFLIDSKNTVFPEPVYREEQLQPLIHTVALSSCGINEYGDILDRNMGMNVRSL
ncbi:hypothetical protein AYI70_g10561 [Smittium culicis]|uniref:Homeobox domain-containing protein n=1 Tax=Smittium culicis TaxID=133412 RepID=A0A1R1X5Y2_9FUNG|nr:hypothetical protein AYI70_g10561 [Smittium culicis]